MILSAKQFKQIDVWDFDMEEWSGYSKDELQKVISEVKAFALEINPKFIQTLRYKFSKPEFLQVSRHAFKF